MDVKQVVTAGLGDNSYVLASGGEAVVVDPQRDAARFLHVLDRRGLTLRFVLETHVHNDYVSGALELRDATKTEIVVPARGGYEFAVRTVAEGDELKIGDLRLVAMETPGHTPEHVSYLVYEAGAEDPVGVFTGGSLMMGGAGRTDLLGPDLTEELTRAQFRTLRRLATLSDAAQVLPTHGAGSFCGAGPAPKERLGPLGVERGSNAALTAPDEEAFVRRQLAGLLAYPTYYREMAAINRRGPRVVGTVPMPGPLSAEEFERRIATGAWAVDARRRGPFARAHVPGSLNVELNDTFGSYVGWLVPFDAPLVLILPEADDGLEEATTQLFRIGYEHVEGFLAGGVDAWHAAGLPVRSYPVAGLEDWCRATGAGAVEHLLDVRQRTEWDRGHVEGSRHLFVGDILEHVGELPPDGETWVVCATGHRASIAASVLDRAGIAPRLVDGTGVATFLKECPEATPAPAPAVSNDAR